MPKSGSHMPKCSTGADTQVVDLNRLFFLRMSGQCLITLDLQQTRVGR